MNDSLKRYTDIDVMKYLFPDQASTIAPEIDLVYFAIMAISLLFIVVIAFAIVALAATYRRRHKDEVGTYEHEPLSLELAWTIIPLFISVGMFAIGVPAFLKAKSIPEGALEIAVVGKQWMWKFQHPNGRREINDLHIPIGQPINFKIVSQDVIHSLYIPAFRIKQDALPMYYTNIWAEPTKIGKYRILCTEYCGKDHSVMGGWVHVLSQEDYETWLQADPAHKIAGRPPLKMAGVSLGGGGTDGQMDIPDGVDEALVPMRDAPGLVKEGFSLFQSLTCVVCHKAESAGVGPSLLGAYGGKSVMANGTTVNFNDNYIRESILNPTAKVKTGYGPVMPAFNGRVSEEDINALIAYIKYLKR